MIGLSSSCFGTRFTHATQIIQACRKLGFERLEMGWGESPLQFSGSETALEDFGVKVSCIRAGARELPRGQYRNTEQLAQRQENERQQAMQSLRQDATLAKTLRTPFISLTAGYVATFGIEDTVRRLLAAVRQGQEKEIDTLREELRKKTNDKRVEFQDRLCRTLFDLARQEPEISWAIETPRDLHFLPTPSELEQIFEDLPNVKLFYFHDSSKAALLEKILKIPHAAWLEQFANRMCGLRLHDLVGVEGHYPPGLGEIDWKIFSGYVPKSTQCVLDISSQHGDEALLTAARFVEKFGIS